MKRIIIIVIAGIAAMFGMTAPAFADGNPSNITANFSLPVALTITGTSPAITFQTLSPGHAQAAHAEVFTVSSNDGNGYTVTLTSDPSQASANQNQFVSQLNGGSDSIMNQGNLSINEASTDAGVNGVDSAQWGQPGTTNAIQIGHAPDNRTLHFDESWLLNYSPTQTANNYHEQFVIQATGN